MDGDDPGTLSREDAVLRLKVALDCSQRQASEHLDRLVQEGRIETTETTLGLDHINPHGPWKGSELQMIVTRYRIQSVEHFLAEMTAKPAISKNKGGAPPLRHRLELAAAAAFLFGLNGGEAERGAKERMAQSLVELGERHGWPVQLTAAREIVGSVLAVIKALRSRA